MKVAIVASICLPTVANLFVYPVGALDVFNYMIELKLAYGYGEKPYLVTFAGYRDDPFALPAFLVDVPLFWTRLADGLRSSGCGGWVQNHHGAPRR